MMAFWQFTHNKTTLISCGALALLGILYSSWVFYCAKSTPQLSSPSELATACFQIAASGEIVPENGVVSLYPRRSDVVAQVWVKAGAILKAGAPIYRLSTDELECQKAECIGALEEAKANLQYLEEQPRPVDLAPLKSEVIRLKADLDRLKKHQLRADALQKSQAVSQAERDEADGLWLVAQGAWQNSVDRYNQTKTGPSLFQKAAAQAQVTRAAANLALIERQIANSTVCAPDDGVVLEVNIHPGEYVSLASFSLTGEQYTKPPVSYGSSKLQISVEVDERLASHLTTNCSGEAVIPGGWGQRIQLRFNRLVPRVVRKSSLAGNPDDVVNAKILRVIFDFDQPAIPLFVGQRLEVKIFPNATITPAR